MSAVTTTVTADSPTIRAQVLNPNRWLIPQQHPDIPRFTTGNRVDALIDGEDTFRALHDAFTAATGRDESYIYITGWDLVPDIHLLGRSVPASTVNTVLAAAAARGVDVRLLIWIVTRAFTITGTNIFMDNKTRGPGSHHQKTAMVRTPDELICFVGGIDMTRDRWDTHAHRFPDPNADYKGAGQPWHDVQARIRGPAAADIETNFRHRWNDTRTVNPPGPLPPIPFPQPTPPAPVHPTPGPVPGGTHIVQTLRTFPRHATAAGFAWPYDFAPSGEFGHLAAFLRAVGNARDYIYIEDQYMISDDIISPAIAAAMRRSEHLQVILVTAPEPDTPPGFAFDFHQNAFVNQLRAVDATRVQFFHLINGTGNGIYCHAKVCVIDDIWAIIGSCNMSMRSLTHDSEISVVVLDQAIERRRRRFARRLRIALWAEHLELTPAEMPLIDDPLLGVDEWRRRASTSPGRALIHIRPAGRDVPGWRLLVDPDGRI